MEKVIIKNYKLLDTVHGIGQIDEYYHVRIRLENAPDKFVFTQVTITENGRYEKEISEGDLPENIKLL